MINEKHIVIYHKNCLDGFGAALAVKHALEDIGVQDIDFYPLDYNERDNFIHTINVKDANIHIVDFSFNKIQTEYLKDLSETFTWLDHHKTAFEEHGISFAQEYVEAIDNGIHIHLSPNLKSGAYLAWRHYMGEVPELIQHIDDRDRWEFKLTGTREICLALSQLPQNFSVWEEHLDDTSDLHHNGRIIQGYYDEQLSRALAITTEECNILGHEGLCANLPPMFASEAGNLLANQSGTYGATWFKNQNGDIKWSLRSIGDYDVSAIAKQFGGGGHKNAAGFTLTPVSGETARGIKLWRT